MTDESILLVKTDLNISLYRHDHGKTAQPGSEKHTHYTHCLAGDKNVLMIDISKAHFLLLERHFLHGDLFRLTERETLCCNVNKVRKLNNKQSFGDFSPLGVIVID